MDPCINYQHMPQRILDPKKSSQQKTLVPDISRSSSFDAMENGRPLTAFRKPMRPLTAYHIYFQIEREFIIQTTSPEIGSTDPNKTFLRDVPRRYRSIRLLPDWYAGPGKRQKRKHRKSHGMIGFLELSRVISKRWATLDTSDPETKRFVTRIAMRELEEYKLEMKVYKELAASAPSAVIAVPSAFTATIQKQPMPGAWPCATMVSPTASPRPDGYFHDDIDDEIDYSICSVSNNGHYIPSPCQIDSTKFIHPDELSMYDPLFELEDGQYVFAQSPISNSLVNMRRCVSPVSSSSSSDVDFLNVDHHMNVGDDDFLELMV
ncbi:hypothetical protein ACHAXA_011559 [Cyclostephanos tholiformis]|jgi:hypothetical protein|uniref:HMG box domain-containing protein n=1 Tax=Cyclostephanos tholiformis TaxID=382380 RepID=A0ABD3SGS6_9STRA